MKILFLVLAVVGAVVPYALFLQLIPTSGVPFRDSLSVLFANNIVASFTADLLLSSLIFWIVMVHQWRKGKGPSPFLFMILNVLIGLSCALPAYLYARELRRGS